MIIDEILTQNYSLETRFLT